ncbi:phosphoribosylamine--glycine ligase [Candidatus Micrarchaeota archaeon]|nr:phosphoribosylamine--glycine ligase [Candidatus Micrarchaeota archaeon]
MKKVLLVALGSTARADCLAHAIHKSHDSELHSFIQSKNPSVMHLSKSHQIGKLDDFSAIKKYAKQVKPDLAIISPDYAIAIGVADILSELNIPVFAPKKSLARLESSKSFTRRLLEKYQIAGSPEHKVFESLEGIRDYMLYLKDFVVKPDGLTGGKGVKVFGEHMKTIDEAVDYCTEIFSSKGIVVIEEKLIGEEFSIQFFTDGKVCLPSPIVQDHKRAFDGDLGPNTGGMGSYSSSNHLLPFLTKEHLQDAQHITNKVAFALKEEFHEYFCGIMYGGFMLTADGVKLIEYNARFGDPEIMNILPILKNDFVEVCEAATQGRLDKIKLIFEEKATVVKYAVPEGYPENPKKGEVIDISEFANTTAKYYLGAVEEFDSHYPWKLKMGTSRAIATVGIANTVEEAEAIAEHSVRMIRGPVFHRKDIGTKELLQRRVDHMAQVRLKK